MCQRKEKENKLCQRKEKGINLRKAVEKVERLQARALCANLAEMHFDREKICNCILTVKRYLVQFSIGKKCNYKWRESFEKQSTQIVRKVHFKCSKNTFQGSSEEKEAKRLLQKQLSDERRVSDLKRRWYFTNDPLKTKIILNDF